MASKVVTKELPNPPPTRGVRKAIKRKTTDKLNCVFHWTASTSYNTKYPKPLLSPRIQVRIGIKFSKGVSYTT
jgi:hypothetical protein